MLDSVKNFVKVNVSQGYDQNALSVILASGAGASLPVAPFNVTWWDASDYADPSDDPNVEIVRITAISGDTLAITRAQEGTDASTKNASGKTYKMILGATAKTITDIGTEIAANTSDIGTLESDVTALDAQVSSNTTSIGINTTAISTINTSLTPALAELAAISGDVEFAVLYSGADMGAQINAAYAALPTTGGTIVIPIGNHSHLTPIVCNTLDKPVLLRGEPGGACTLTYTGTGTTVACTINVTKAVTPGYGIQGIKFVGPSSAGSTVGIQLGGMGADDGQGFAGGTLRDVHVRGFGCNILIGNNVFILTLDNVVSNFGGVLLFAKGGAGAGATSWLVNGANTINSGERMVAMNCTFADANNQLGQSTARYAVHLQESGLTDWKFTGCSFDDAELYLDISGGTSNQVQLDLCHFENPAADSIGAYTFITGLTGSTTTSLDLTDCTFVQDANSSAAPSFISAGCQVTAKGCSIGRNSGAGAATLGAFVSFLNADSTNNLRFMGITSFQNAATNIATSSAGSYAMTGGIGVVNGAMVTTKMSGSAILFAQSFNTIYDASQFAGSDIGAQINAAYAFAVAQGVKGCKITLPAGSFSFPTPVAITTDGVRAEICGQGGDATILTFTGGSTTTAFTFNCGYQGDGAGSEHAHYRGLSNLTLKGNNTSKTNPEVGVFLGGANGAAGIIIDNCKIEGFGQGLVTGSNTYMYSVQNTVIRNCGQNIYIGGSDNGTTNSGEGVSFINCFIVDPAGNAPADGFFIDNSGATSVTIIGGSFDDCQVHIQQANVVTFIGTHFENPGHSAWGSYTYVLIDQNPATTVNMVGCEFWVDSTTVSGQNPPNFISNGGTLMLSGCWVRTTAASVITNFAAITGSGSIQWTQFNRVGSTVITNVVSGIPYVQNGWTDSSGAFATMGKSGVLVARAMYTAQTATYAILTTDEMVDCTSGTFTVTLPTAVGVSGKPYEIKNSGTGTITVATTSSQTIDGVTTRALSTQYGAMTVKSDGANWKIIG